MTVLPVTVLDDQAWQLYFTFFHRNTRRYLPREWTGNGCTSIGEQGTLS